MHGPADQVVCSNCNDESNAATEHSLRFDRAGGERRDVTVYLCDTCATDILAVGWIEHRQQAADD
ncbi:MULTISPECIES: hypothetical protein [unclassified Halobacterium]|uniref:hypothetical protein n=1 Tax=unclassified Halobacterium TaxID=2668073 RepID=UPI001E2C02F1|nr:MULTISPECIES: hypothetical protein [unclassified Halobacterium]MCD2198875.1 hypothetical protein [Halobacterium sp. KA-4]MCD2202891.1 hypothetical protein [Halobacterium sp. KA-6]